MIMAGQARWHGFRKLSKLHGCSLTALRCTSPAHNAWSLAPTDQAGHRAVRPQHTPLRRGAVRPAHAEPDPCWQGGAAWGLACLSAHERLAVKDLILTYHTCCPSLVQVKSYLEKRLAQYGVLSAEHLRVARAIRVRDILEEGAWGWSSALCATGAGAG